MGTKNFISYWASPLYVHASILKKYVIEIPTIMTAHHKDIIFGHRRFFGKMRLIGDCQGHTITQYYVYMSRTLKNTILHIQGNTRHC
jgi:hypothetical protein